MARQDDRDRKPKEPSFGNDALKQALQKAAMAAPAAPSATPAPTRATKPPPPPPPGRKKSGPLVDDHDGDALFLAVMDDVAPVAKKPSQAPAPVASGALPGPTAASVAARRRQEDAESFAQLAELVASPDTLVTRTHGADVDGVAAGVDVALLEPLKRGDFGSIVAHRFTDAVTLERTLAGARREGTRVVRIDGAVATVVQALVSGRGPKLVLAFAGRGTGLTGHVDVLLRR